MERVVNQTRGQFELAMASLEESVVELSSKPHQPRKLKFPKTEYGKKVSILASKF